MTQLTNTIAVFQVVIFAAFIVAVGFLVVNVIKEQLNAKSK